MYSPFPGMDPYLERPDHWSGVHARLIAVFGEILARRISPRFFVDSEDHVYILGHDDPGRVHINPDVYMVDAGRGAVPSGARARVAAPMLMDLPMNMEIRVSYLRIIDTRGREVVTTIELLSPINKEVGSKGRSEFRRKRDRVLASSTHWLEIDLLRAGMRSPDVPSLGDYAAILRRAGVPDKQEGWFMSLRDPLPIIVVPLTQQFADVPLDLQEAVESVYDRYRYDAVIDYDEAPPLPEPRREDVAWMRERIAAWRQTRDG